MNLSLFCGPYFWTILRTRAGLIIMLTLIIKIMFGETPVSSCCPQPTSVILPLWCCLSWCLSQIFCVPPPLFSNKKVTPGTTEFLQDPAPVQRLAS